MVHLEDVSWGDLYARWQLVTKIPAEENGFTNEDCDCSLTDFQEWVLPKYENHARGVGLPPGFSAESYYVLWESGLPVGLFRLRHRLNDALSRKAGHVGYFIAPEYRGRGLATVGLAQLLEKARIIVPEDEIYLSSFKSNIASLRVQLKNGAYLHHEDEKYCYMRIAK